MRLRSDSNVSGRSVRLELLEERLSLVEGIVHQLFGRVDDPEAADSSTSSVVLILLPHGIVTALLQKRPDARLIRVGGFGQRHLRKDRGPLYQDKAPSVSDRRRCA